MVKATAWTDGNTAASPTADDMDGASADLTTGDTVSLATKNLVIDKSVGSGDINVSTGTFTVSGTFVLTMDAGGDIWVGGVTSITGSVIPSATSIFTFNGVTTVNTGGVLGANVAYTMYLNANTTNSGGTVNLGTGAKHLGANVIYDQHSGITNVNGGSITGVSCAWNGGNPGTGSSSFYYFGGTLNWASVSFNLIVISANVNTPGTGVVITVTGNVSLYAWTISVGDTFTCTVPGTVITSAGGTLIIKGALVLNGNASSHITGTLIDWQIYPSAVVDLYYADLHSDTASRHCMSLGAGGGTNITNVRIDHCSFTSHAGDGRAGVNCRLTAATALTNCTFTGLNGANYYEKDVYVSAGCAIELSSCILTHNTIALGATNGWFVSRNHNGVTNAVVICGILSASTPGAGYQIADTDNVVIKNADAYSAAFNTVFTLDQTEVMNNLTINASTTLTPGTQSLTCNGVVKVYGTLGGATAYTGIYNGIFTVESGGVYDPGTGDQTFTSEMIFYDSVTNTATMNAGTLLALASSKTFTNSGTFVVRASSAITGVSLTSSALVNSGTWTWDDCILTTVDVRFDVTTPGTGVELALNNVTIDALTVASGDTLIVNSGTVTGNSAKSIVIAGTLSVYNCALTGYESLSITTAYKQTIGNVVLTGLNADTAWNNGPDISIGTNAKVQFINVTLTNGIIGMQSGAGWLASILQNGTSDCLYIGVLNSSSPDEGLRLGDLPETANILVQDAGVYGTPSDTILTFVADANNNMYDTVDIGAGTTVKLIDGLKVFVTNLTGDGTWDQGTGYGGMFYIGSEGDVVYHTFELELGWNLISFPFASMSYYGVEVSDASDLCAVIDLGDTQVIAKIDGVYYTYIEGEGSPEINFSAGIGLYVWVSDDVSLGSYGEVYSGDSVDLVVGWNLVSTAVAMNASFYSLLSENITAVVGRAIDGSYVSFIVGVSPPSDDFDLVLGQAYYVYSNAEVTISLSTYID
jgi:hypothetical protein